MRQVFYLVQKEFRQVFRDKSMIAVLFVAPLLQLFVLGNAITTDVTRIALVVHDADRTPQSRELIERFSHIEYFDVLGHESEYRALTAWIDRGDAKLALVIPRNFQRDMLRGDRPAVQLLVDGIDGNSAGVALGYASQIAQEQQLRILASEPQLGRTMRGMRIVQAVPRFWYNPNLESAQYIVPGLIGLLLLIITVFLTSMGIVREKEIGTLDQIIVSPIRSWQLILGKIIPFSILGFVEIVVAIGFIYLLFGIGIEGSVWLLFAESAIFILTTLGTGIFISTISETQQQALFVGWFFMIFAILLSGLFIPISNMPDIVQAITYLNPLRYFFIILREIYLKGAGLMHIWQETAALAAFGLLVFSLAVMRYRRKLG